MNQTDLMWLAGWLEGEGTFTSHTTKRGYTRLIVRAVSVDLDVIKRAHKLAGVGRIYGPYHYPPRQPHWQWAITKRAESLKFMRMIQPSMCQRRQKQISAAIEIGGTP